MPKIIFLEHNNNTPDNVKLVLDFLEQGQFEYNVPAMKFLTYTIEELNEQHMVILLPLYLLKLRKEIEKAKVKGTLKENAGALKKLMNGGILKSIDDNEKAGNITHHDSFVLTGLVNSLYDHLYGNIEEFKAEGVKAMLAEKLILEYEVEIAEAVKVAEEKAKEKAMLNTVIKMIKKGMSPDDICELTEFPIDQIEKLQIQQC